MLHLHIRDKDQNHTLDVNQYRETIEAVKRATDNQMLVQITSEAVGIYQPEQQMEVIESLKPGAASLALREFIREPSEEDAAIKFFNRVAAQGTLPQYILYSPEEVAHFGVLRKAGNIPGDKVMVLFVLGKKQAVADIKSQFATPDDLDPFLECFTDGHLKLSETIWSVCAFGGNENACMVKTAECGGHPRIGFENNHFMPDGSVAKNNAQLVRLFVDTLNKN